MAIIELEAYRVKRESAGGNGARAAKANDIPDLVAALTARGGAAARAELLDELLAEARHVLDGRIQLIMQERDAEFGVAARRPRPTLRLVRKG